MRWLGVALVLGVVSMVPWQIGVPKRSVVVQVGDLVVRAEVARTVDEQVRGLAGHASLGPTDGMLFPYDPPAEPTFWMRGVDFPIDLIWIREERVTGVEEDMPADGGVRRYRAPSAVDAVLEVQSGFVREHGILLGDTVKIDGE